MATRFVRVDLSEEARDYRPIAVEPGVPMLDRSGANPRILFRWLGGMVAEPVWEDDLLDSTSATTRAGGWKMSTASPSLRRICKAGFATTWPNCGSGWSKPVAKRPPNARSARC